MSGHSKWAKLKHSKGLVDVKKGAVLTRVSKDIITAVKIGGSGDPAFNPMLRLAIQKGKDANMTNDKVEKAIKKGLGTSSSDEVTYENTYEAYGPGGFGILIDTESDNPNRTITDIKTIVNKNGGKMAGEKSISWQFTEVGYIKIEASKNKISELEEKLLDVDGIEDISNEEEGSGYIEVIIQRESFRDAYSKIGGIAINTDAKIEDAKLIMQTKNTLELTDEELEKASEFIEKIEEIPEVTNVWTNIS